MIAAIGKFLLAVVVGSAAVVVLVCSVTGRWPSLVVVENKLAAAECSLAFSDGFTWNVALNEGQERYWLFILGRPEKVEFTCAADGRSVAQTHYFCGAAFRDRIVLSEIEPRSPCVDR